MPSIRIGFSTDFNLVGEQVGIGTTNPTARLEVAGQILADNTAGSGGISTLTTYDGFLQSAQGIGNTVSIAETSKGNLNSLSGEIKISGEVTVTGDTPVAGGRLDSLTVTDKFDLPHGGSEYKDDAPEKGTTRFNEDLGQLEFYTGLEWRTVGSIADTGGRGRGIWSGGADPAETSLIDFATISTLGNAQNFGDLDTAVQRSGSCASSTRGLIGGGGFPNETNVIQYITIASQGNSINFGDLLGEGVNNERAETSALSSSTRGVWGGGGQYPDASTNRIDYVEIATIGNSIDFGDLTIIKDTNGAVSNGTRGLFCGGATSSVIDAITISSTGNSIDIGDLTQARSRNAGVSNSTRGVIGGGLSPILLNTIDYVTIANNGNAIDFGDLNNAIRHPGACSSQTRGLWGGGLTPAEINVIDYVTITTTGNAQDFGDLSTARSRLSALSDSHGGLGGF